MVNSVIIDDNWKGEIRNITIKFNNFAKKGSMRMSTFIIDKLFDILSDDNDTNQIDAAKALQRIKAANPNLVSSYISTLLDAKIGQFCQNSSDYVTPDISKYPVTEHPRDQILVIEEQIPSDDDSMRENPFENKKDEPPAQDGLIESSQLAESSGGELLSWDLMQLIQFKIVKNIKPITYEEIDTPTRKCTCADGKFSKGEEGVWACTECMAPYHENCIKIVSILEGRCRICEESFLVGDGMTQYEEDSDK